MNLPEHVLWTYAFQEIVLSDMASKNPSFLAVSLISAALPDILETTPLLVYLYVNRKKFGLNRIKEVINFSYKLDRDDQEWLLKIFPNGVKISFFTHSLLVCLLVSLFIFYFSKTWALVFLFGYGLHIITDLFLHKDIFSSRPLYPISNFKIKGFITWYKVKNFSLYNYLILAMVLLFILIKK